MGDMTPEQEVGVFVAKLNRPYWQGGFQNDGEVSEAVMGLLRAERERCARVADEAIRGEGKLWARPVADPRGDREPDCSDVLDRLAAAIRAGDERESDR